VENVSYEEAIELCRKLSALAAERRAGRLYRLPSEAEWEHACRGVAPSYQAFHFGDSLSSKQANFNRNLSSSYLPKEVSLERTCKVGSYAKNRFGLHDMHGNVAEWCSDWYGDDYYGKSPRRDPQGPPAGNDRVVRGGSWLDDRRHCRSASRFRNRPDARNIHVGFRVVLVLADR
jgi:formylglycine-generating enzyme required for sulfatase activity